jgi:hypothetical protein
VSFPTTPLVVKIEFAFGADLAANPATWTYQDRTADWLADRDLAATVGRADATSKAQPGSLSFWLKNPTGDYTKGNPFSQFWPNIRKNTPCRVTLDPGTGHTRQYVMYVTKWLPRWTDNSGGQPLVQVVAAGVRRRLSQGDTPLRSPLYRAAAALSPLAHWSFEDDRDATSAGSVVPGVGPLVVSSGTVSFGVDGPAGAVAAADITNGVLTGRAPAGVGTSWAAHAVFRAHRPAPGNVIVQPMVSWSTVDGARWDVLIAEDPVTGASTIGYDAGVDGMGFNSLSIGTAVNCYDGNWHSVVFMVTRLTSTTCLFEMYVDDQYTSATRTRTFSPVGGVVEFPGRLNFLGTDALNISHMALYDTAIVPTSLLQARTGYAGETAHDRIVRLCGEQGVAATVSANAITPMGAQKPDPFLGLLDDCQNADGGILLDGLNPGSRTWPGRTRTTCP